MRGYSHQFDAVYMSLCSEMRQISGHWQTQHCQYRWMRLQMLTSENVGIGQANPRDSDQRVGNQ